jgi:hypothetical protein
MEILERLHETKHMYSSFIPLKAYRRIAYIPRSDDETASFKPIAHTCSFPYYVSAIQSPKTLKKVPSTAEGRYIFSNIIIMRLHACIQSLGPLAPAACSRKKNKQDRRIVVKKRSMHTVSCCNVLDYLPQGKYRARDFGIACCNWRFCRTKMSANTWLMKQKMT